MHSCLVCFDWGKFGLWGYLLVLIFLTLHSPSLVKLWFDWVILLLPTISLNMVTVLYIQLTTTFWIWINQKFRIYTDNQYKACLECRLTRHGAPHFFRRRCGGRFERHKLGRVWRVRQHSGVACRVREGTKRWSWWPATVDVVGDEFWRRLDWKEIMRREVRYGDTNDARLPARAPSARPSCKKLRMVTLLTLIWHA
jgi:hypothetical protein